MATLPFNCCALSLQPFSNPVCSPNGIVFDIMYVVCDNLPDSNIVPFLRKFKKNPVTGEQLKLAELVKLNYFKNEKGEFHDPISYKTFTDYSHIVAVRISGNVY